MLRNIKNDRDAINEIAKTLIYTANLSLFERL